MKLFYYYLIIINLFTFFFYGVDKFKAQKNKWRIPESRLLFFAAAGGSVGAYIGMHVWHHKTKHAIFRIGIPVIFLVQLLILFLLSILRNL